MCGILELCISVPYTIMYYILWSIIPTITLWHVVTPFLCLQTADGSDTITNVVAIITDVLDLVLVVVAVTFPLGVVTFTWITAVYLYKTISTSYIYELL